jgi:hypothetical protein
VDFQVVQMRPPFKVKYIVILGSQVVWSFGYSKFGMYRRQAGFAANRNARAP